MFRGQFAHSIDSKGRVSLPARFRESLLSPSDNRFVLTGALFDPCLHVYPMRAWEAFEAKISELPSMDVNVVRFRRMYVSAAVECELDTAGRVLIPLPMREKARIEKDVIWAGMGTLLELWSKNEWDQSLAMTATEAADFKQAVMEQIRI